MQQSAMIHKMKLADFVYHKVFEEIADGSLEVGSRLPSEQVLSVEHGVSRSVVRQALSRLRDEGMVVSRKGSGTYVTGKVSVSMKDGSKEPLTIVAIQCCYEYRLAVECESAYLAAQRRNKDLVRTLRRHNAKVARAAEQDVHDAEADFDLHLEVSRAANNYLFFKTMGFIRDHTLLSMKIGGACMTGGEYSFDALIREHEDIIDAISEGDCDRAKISMHDHIANARDRVFEGHLIDLSATD